MSVSPWAALSSRWRCGADGPNYLLAMQQSSLLEGTCYLEDRLSTAGTLFDCLRSECVHCGHNTLHT